MALITTTNFQAMADKLCAAWLQTLAACGTNVGNPISSGNVRATINNLLTYAVTDLNDYEQIFDLATPCKTASAQATAEGMISWMRAVLAAFDNHFQIRGKEVDASIVSTTTYLNYYNGGNGGSLFSALLCPEMQYLYSTFSLTTGLPPEGIMSPALNPVWNGAVSAHGMGDKVVAGSFTAGTAVNTTLYAEVQPIAEVTTTITGGSGAISLVVAGVDNTGATTTTWSSGTLTGGNNPVAALSGLTITPAIVAYTKLSVVVSSSTGIVVGSVLTINKGLPDQENVIVEAVADSTHITAAFKVAHTGGATIDGFTSTALTPSVSGRRLRSVTGITFTVLSHSAGTVRISGGQDRCGI